MVRMMTLVSGHSRRIFCAAARTVEARHRDVQYRDMRLKPAREIDGLSAVRDVRDDLIAFALEQCPHSSEQHEMIVGEKDL